MHFEIDARARIKSKYFDFQRNENRYPFYFLYWWFGPVSNLKFVLGMHASTESFNIKKQIIYINRWFAETENEFSKK